MMESGQIQAGGLPDPTAPLSAESTLAGLKAADIEKRWCVRWLDGLTPETERQLFLSREQAEAYAEDARILNPEWQYKIEETVG